MLNELGRKTEHERENTTRKNFLYTSKTQKLSRGKMNDTAELSKPQNTHIQMRINSLCLQGTEKLRTGNAGSDMR
jgi:hypothetical protein